jgi:hypothetical protein
VKGCSTLFSAQLAIKSLNKEAKPANLPYLLQEDSGIARPDTAECLLELWG